MAAVPLCPSDVAVIVVEPAATPVTRPLPFTVAAAVLELVHVTVRPVRMLPLASFTVALSGTVWPTCTDAVAGLTVTDATGTVATVIAAVPLFPSLVAVRDRKSTRELQSPCNLVCRLLLEKKKKKLSPHQHEPHTKSQHTGSV